METGNIKTKGIRDILHFSSFICTTTGAFFEKVKMPSHLERYYRMACSRILSLDTGTGILSPSSFVVLTALCRQNATAPFWNFRSLLAETCGNTFLFSFWLIVNSTNHKSFLPQKRVLPHSKLSQSCEHYIPCWVGLCHLHLTRVSFVGLKC